MMRSTTGSAIPSETTKQAQLSAEEQRGMLLAIIEDFQHQPVDVLQSYFEHVGFDITTVASVDQFTEAWCGFYRVKAGVYDIERAFQDLANWPIMARVITELALAKCRGLPNDL